MEIQLDPPRSSEEAVRRITGGQQGNAPSEELRRATTTLLAEHTPPSSTINLELQESRPADLAHVELVGPRGPWSFVIIREITALAVRTITGRQKKGDPDLFDIFGIKRMGEVDFDWDETKEQMWIWFQIHVLLRHLGPEDELTTAQREDNERTLWERWSLHLSRIGMLHIAQRAIGGSLAAMVAIACLVGGWQYWHAPDTTASQPVSVAVDPRLSGVVGESTVNAPTPIIPQKMEWNRLQPVPPNDLETMAEEDPSHHAEIFLLPGVKGSTQYFPAADPSKPETMKPIPFALVGKEAIKMVAEVVTTSIDPTRKLDRVYAFPEGEPAIYSYAKKPDGSRGLPLYEFVAKESTRTRHVYRIMPIVDRQGKTVMTREQRVAGLKDPQTYYFPLLADIPNVRTTLRLTVTSPAGVEYPRAVTIGILPRMQ